MLSSRRTDAGGRVGDGPLVGVKGHGAAPKGLMEGLAGHKASQVGDKTGGGHTGQSLGVADTGRQEG